jgi:hypothetical protein
VTECERRWFERRLRQKQMGSASARKMCRKLKPKKCCRADVTLGGGGGRTRGTSQLLGSVNALHFSLRSLFFGRGEQCSFGSGSIGSSFVGESMLVVACVFTTDADIICSSRRLARQRVLNRGVGGGAGT